MNRKKINILILFALLLITTNMNAQIGEKTTIHGFGAWSYGKTDGNNYLAGDPDGNFDQAYFSLNVTASVSQNLRINSQMFWFQNNEGEEVELDFAFAEWLFSESLKFRIGKIKHPFGIYTEIFDVGTIRPFFSLPQGLYGNSGFISEAYLGLGFTGALFRQSNWGIQYDVYGGEIQIDSDDPTEGLSETEQNSEEEEKLEIHNLVGIRLILTTPFDGLKFGFSAYTGSIENVDNNRHNVIGFHTEYNSDVWFLAGEYARHELNNNHKDNAFYLEGAYKFDDHWQAAARYDWLESSFTIEDENIIIPPSLSEHKDMTLGINYWFNTNFVLKFSYHRVKGNRFAIPDELLDAVADVNLDTSTNLILLGGQFSF